MKDLTMFSWGQVVAPGSRLPQCSLVCIVVNGDGTGHFAACGTGKISDSARSSLTEYLCQPIALDVNGNRFTRLSLLRTVRDKEAAHSDKEVGVVYKEFILGGFLGAKLVRKVDQESTPIKSPHGACIRTIAHEFLYSLYAWDFTLLPRSYQEPIDALEKDYCLSLQMGPLIAPDLSLNRNDWTFTWGFPPESQCCGLELVISAAWTCPDSTDGLEVLDPLGIFNQIDLTDAVNRGLGLHRAELSTELAGFCVFASSFF